MAIPTVITLDKNTAKKIYKGIYKPIKDTKALFKVLATQIDRDTIKTFENEGSWAGRKKWAPFSENTVRTPKGTWNIRYGTDLKGRPGKQGQFREGVRRYNSKSKLLQASGLFRQSFQVLKTTKKKMLYGTRHKLGGKIGSHPTRQVIQYTDTDQRKYGRLLKTYIVKGMF